MSAYEESYHPTDQMEHYKRRAFQTDLLKLTVAVVAELLIFLLWFDGPARERYEILVHIALPICIVLPIINYRYLIVVPFIAFLPDVARAFGIDISHSLIILAARLRSSLRAFYTTTKDRADRSLCSYRYIRQSPHC